MSTRIRWRHPAPRQAGLTLIELIVAMAIMLAAIAAASTVFVAGASLVSNSQRQVEDNGNARIAADQIVSAIQSAGFGALGGVCVNNAGAAKFVSPIFGADGNTSPSAGALNTNALPDTTTTSPAMVAGTDDLWVVVPDRNALEQANKTSVAANACHCVNPKTGAAPPLPGAMTVLAQSVAASTSPLPVLCTGSLSATAGAEGNQLLVSNGSSAALLTVSSIAAAETCSPVTAGTFTYAESALAAFSDSAAKGFQAGDMVFGVKVLHFYVGTDPTTAAPALYEAAGAPTGTVDYLGRPFQGTSIVTSTPGVEDLQIAYGFDPTGSGNPDSYVWQAGMTPVPYGASPPYPGLGTAPLVALRITVVTKSAKIAVDARGADSLTANALYARPAVENHAAGAPDGYQRSSYVRIVGIGNMTPGAI